MSSLLNALLTGENVKYFCDKVYMDGNNNMQNAIDTIRIFVEQQEQGNIYMMKSFILTIDDCVREYGDRWWTFPSLDALIQYERTREFNKEYLRNGVGKFIFALSSGCYILCTDFMDDEYISKDMLRNRQLDKQIEEYLHIDSKYKEDFENDYKIVMNEARIIQKAYDKELESDNFGYAFYINLPKDKEYEVITQLTHLTVFRIVDK